MPDWRFELSTASLRPEWRLRAIIQSQDGSAGGSSSRASPARTSIPTQGGESRIIISPGGAADPPPVRASHLRRDKPIDGKEESVQATRLPLQEQGSKVLFRWAT